MDKVGLFGWYNSSNSIIESGFSLSEIIISELLKLLINPDETGLSTGSVIPEAFIAYVRPGAPKNWASIPKSPVKLTSPPTIFSIVSQVSPP